MAVLTQNGETNIYHVPLESGGQRLDKVLVALVGDVSRARLQTLIRDGCVRVDGAFVADPKHKVADGAEIVLRLPPPAPGVPQPEPIPLDVVFEDDHVIVINKPAGLVVHPGAGHSGGTLVNALLAHCGDSLSGIGGVVRPGIVHRLDRDTTGLLVATKTDQAHRALSAQFSAHGADGRMSRRYRALAWGKLPRPIGTIDAPLARSVANRLRITVTDPPRGRHAVTHYKVLNCYSSGAPYRGKPNGDEVSDLQLELETGRTHQIRVHLAHIRHPLLGDAVYGAGFKTRISALRSDAACAVGSLGRQALHAAHLGFEHPVTGAALVFDAPLPDDLTRVMTALSCPSPT